MEKNNFTSNAEEVRYYVLEVLKGGKTYARKYIKGEVTKLSGRKFSEGTFSGALRKLVNENPNVVSPRQGVYQLIGDPNDINNGDINLLAIKTYKKMIDDITDVAKQVNPLYITDEEQKTLNNIRDSIDYINQAINKLKE